jgi:molybdenum cofactor cytidylyltransferase
VLNVGKQCGSGGPAAIGAVVPAAGRGGRVGGGKPLLPVDGRPMLRGLVEALLAGGVSHAVVVAGGHDIADRLGGLDRRAEVVVRQHASHGEMIDSVRAGLRVLATAGEAFGGYLICPCDVAGLTPADVRRCVDAFAHTPNRIVIATHAGRRGHPMIFPASLEPLVQSDECRAGLNHLARGRPQLVREVPCDSPAVLANVNTPEDYRRLT